MAGKDNFSGNTVKSAAMNNYLRRYTYDAFGNPQRRKNKAVSRGEELLRAFTFDAANHMTSAIWYKDGVEYNYRYDMAGNKIQTRRQRHGTDEDTGTFGYAYDALNRLTEVSRNGQLLRRYTYDPFGNRASKEDYSGQTPSRTTYGYNANN